jgi:hypothetical protein
VFVCPWTADVLIVLNQLQASVHVRTSLQRLAEGQAVLAAHRLADTGDATALALDNLDRLDILSQVRYHRGQDANIPPPSDMADSYNDWSINQETGGELQIDLQVVKPNLLHRSWNQQRRIQAMSREGHTLYGTTRILHNTIRFC